MYAVKEKVFQKRQLVGWDLHYNINKYFYAYIQEKSIVSIGYLTRLQMDLIDMRNIQDGEYKWILHIKDLFTKFSWAYPLKSNETAAIAKELLQQFCLFGAPCVLQCASGNEFVAKVLQVGSLPFYFGCTIW